MACRPRARPRGCVLIVTWRLASWRRALHTFFCSQKATAPTVLARVAHTHTESHCVKPLTFDPRAATRRSRRGSAHRPCAAATTRQPVQIAKGHEATAKHSSSAEAIGSRPWQLMNLAQCVSPHHSKAVAPNTSARRGDAQPHATKPLRAFSTTPTTPCSPHKQTPRAPCCGLVLAACTRLAMPAPPTHLP